MELASYTSKYNLIALHLFDDSHKIIYLMPKSLAADTTLFRRSCLLPMFSCFCRIPQATHHSRNLYLDI